MNKFLTISVYKILIKNMQSLINELLIFVLIYFLVIEKGTKVSFGLSLWPIWSEGDKTT